MVEREINITSDGKRSEGTAERVCELSDYVDCSDNELLKGLRL